MRSRLFIAAFTGIVFVASAARAPAALIQITYEGTVTGNQIAIGPFAGIPVGTVMKYQTVIDTTQTWSASGHESIYRHNEELATISAPGLGTISGLPQTSPAPNASNAAVRFAGDEFDYELTPRQITLDIPGQPPVNVTLTLNGFDDTQNPFNGTRFIEQNLGVYSGAPSIWDGERLFLITATGHPTVPFNRSLGVNLTSVTIAAVPEPTSLALLGVGAMGLAARRQGRRG